MAAKLRGCQISSNYYFVHMLLPSSFLRGHIHLSWSDILWGYEHQLIGWSVPVDLATDNVDAGSNNFLEIEMAGLQKSEAQQVGEILQKLMEKEGMPTANLTKQKWLYLTLSWLFENRDSIFDPLGEVENIYADFSYPSEITSFVRYMPATDAYRSDQHSKAENEDRLFDQWKKYLLDTKKQFAR